jgi:hypothetical protein
VIEIGVAVDWSPEASRIGFREWPEHIGKKDLKFLGKKQSSNGPRNIVRIPG